MTGICKKGDVEGNMYRSGVFQGKNRINDPLPDQKNNRRIPEENGNG